MYLSPTRECINCNYKRATKEMKKGENLVCVYLRNDVLEDKAGERERNRKKEREGEVFASSLFPLIHGTCRSVSGLVGHAESFDESADFSLDEREGQWIAKRRNRAAFGGC